MVYCSQCGTQNEEDAHFCKTCGHVLTPGLNHRDREWDNRCEQDCAGKNNFPHI
ncbi:MAG: zinc-ribbon domain-containing protein, partial [Candidatus Thermoplasmatota archaeon]|nr:zinc-ribbon domain-containing protein [Candidatus Thermoplasmatota archaeon]MBU1940878.1 zinc-ribbon domain-containing protein [Candidatus Thermoplasmatota archaeon]